MTIKLQPSTGGAAAPADSSQLQQIRNDLGLGNVDNTADAEKPVSIAQAAADNARVPKSVASAKGQLLVGTGTGAVGALGAPGSGAVLVGDPSAAEGLSYLALDDRDSELGVLSADSAATIKSLVESLLPEQVANSPAGRGRRVRLPAYKLTTIAMSLSTMQSVVGAGLGSSTLSFDVGTLPAVGPAVTTAVLTNAGDMRKERGVKGQGVLAWFSVDGNRQSQTIAGHKVHGYWAPSATESVSHNFEYVHFCNLSGDGVRIENNNDQTVGTRLKATNNKGIGIVLRWNNDSKLFAPGSGDNEGGALLLEHCATPKLYGVDFWLGATFTGTWTVQLIDQARALFCGGEISGRIGIMGRNDLGLTIRYDMAGNRFEAINFKIDETLTPAFDYTRDDLSTVNLNCFMYVEDVDGLAIHGCTLIYNDVVPSVAAVAATPDYFIQVGTTATGAPNVAQRPGAIKFSSMEGLVHRRGRAGDASYPPILAFKKHYCSRPELIEWDFPVGGLVEIAWDDANPPRNYVKAGPFGGAGAVYSKSDFPLGYLWATLATRGTLDDGVTTFTVPPAHYAAPAGRALAMRVWP